MVCGAAAGVLDHHVSYDPEETAAVCRSCHTRIHKNEGLRPDLTPDSVPQHRRFPKERDGTTVRLEDRVHRLLTGYAEKGETYSEAVERLLEEA